MTEAPDAIYFLMFPGWEKEFRSNRWHYASRWARHLPVVLVQTRDDSLDDQGFSIDEPRIHGTRILQVTANPLDRPTFLNGLSQARQVLTDMARHGYKRPIFWAYSPEYLLAYAMIPSALRVYHASENYFAFKGLAPKFMASLSSMVHMADLVVAVSDGVAKSFQAVASQPVEVVTNGCEYGFYARGKPDEELARFSASFSRIAIYGGNINDRLDFDLILKLVQGQPDTFFAFYGRVAGLDEHDEAVWANLVKHANFRHFGAVPAERLPDVYMTAHVGIVPYKQRGDLLDNLFPLKIFEMLSAGIPVVSSPFASLQDKTCTALRLAGDDDSFAAALVSADRRTLTDAERQAVAALCRAQDYDQKFETVRAMVQERARTTASAPIAGLLAYNDADDLQQWLRKITEANALMLGAPAVLCRVLLANLGLRFLTWVNNHCPAWVCFMVNGSVDVARLVFRRGNSNQGNNRPGQI